MTLSTWIFGKQKWEYRAFAISGNALQTTLNSMGAESWEVFQMIHPNFGDGSPNALITIYARRPL